MTSPDDTFNFVEIYTEPIAVLEIGTEGPLGKKGDPGEKGDPGPAWPDFQGTWNSDTRYDKDDAVSYEKGIFVTTGLGEVGVPPLVDGFLSSGWYYVARPGEDGEDGDPGQTGPAGPPSFIVRGDWDPNQVYVPGDLVRYNGSIYIAINQSVNNDAPDDPTYWNPFDFAGSATDFPETAYTGGVPAGVSPLVEHNLNSIAVNVVLVRTATNTKVDTDVVFVDENNIQLLIDREELNPEDNTYSIRVFTSI